jgi:hypothetical protein
MSNDARAREFVHHGKSAGIVPVLTRFGVA